MVALEWVKRGAACALVVLVTVGARGGEGDARAGSCTNLHFELLGTAQLPSNVQGIGRVGGLSGMVGAGPVGWPPRPGGGHGGSAFLVVSDAVPTAMMYRLVVGLEKGEDGSFELELTLDRAVELRCDASDAESIVGVLPVRRSQRDAAVMVGFERPACVRRFAAFELGEETEFLEGFGHVVLPREVVMGVRDNRAVESMAWVGGGDGWGSMVFGDRLWVAMEAALVGDGERATAEAGTLCRVLEFGGGEGRGLELSRQFFYETEPSPAGKPAVNTLAEMCGVECEGAADGERGGGGGGGVLMLERSFGLLQGGWGAELFVCDGEVEEREGLAFPVLKKERVGDLREMGLVLMGNMEGMAFGGTVAEMVGDEEEEGRVLVLVADDNFGRDGQVGSQVVVLRVWEGESD